MRNNGLGSRDYCRLCLVFLLVGVFIVCVCDGGGERRARGGEGGSCSRLLADAGRTILCCTLRQILTSDAQNRRQFLESSQSLLLKAMNLCCNTRSSHRGPHPLPRTLYFSLDEVPVCVFCFLILFYLELILSLAFLLLLLPL